MRTLITKINTITQPYINKIGIDRAICLFLVIAAFGTILTVLTMQYYMGIDPCILCHYQRIPFYFSGICGLVTLCRKIKPIIRRLIIALCACAFFINIGIAIYHSGVERHWWEGTDACAVALPADFDINNIENLDSVLFKPDFASCSKISWSLFNTGVLTLAVLNILGSSFMFIVTILAALNRKWWQIQN